VISSMLLLHMYILFNLGFHEGEAKSMYNCKIDSNGMTYVEILTSRNYNINILC
jgi:hypothetical protein